MNEVDQRQTAIRAKCFHPIGQWEEFSPQDLEQSVVSRFEQMVARYPNRLAVQFGNDKLTYAELNTQANQLARAILKQCGQDARPILFLLDQGVGAMIALIGILKAGKCYVALDSEFPIARLTAILAACQSTLLVTQHKHQALAQQLMSNQPFGQLLMLNQSFDHFEKMNLGLIIAPDSLAYITFTSGTTGLPKGVPQSHRYLLRITQVFTNACHICPQDRIALTYSNAFGIAGLQIFLALLNGASLWPFVLSDGLGALVTWLAVAQITYWDTVPSVFRQLNPQPNHQVGPALRVLGMGGERITPADIGLFQRHFLPSTLLHISYGLSEANGLAFYWVDHDTQITGARVPVGYSPRDTTLLLFDEKGQPVADGEMGEIVVKSRYITAGYWQQPALNLGRFVPDPQDSDARLFYTGDLGLIQPDGCLIHLGRKDHQVKIRGVRVELAEIEQALWGMKLFKDVFVTANAGPDNQLCLVAYLVMVDDLTVKINVIRQYLSTLLPVAMMPAAYVFLQSLPLNANRKVDMKALPALMRNRPDLEVAYMAPRNEIESQLVKIWQEVLFITPIGIEDHFLDLGGDSLQANQIIGRSLKQFHIEISPHVLMAKPTVAQMSMAIIQSRSKLVDEQLLDAWLREFENDTK